MPTVITTSTASTATAYSNQRKIDRCQNGVLWMMHRYTSGTTNAPGFAHSTDNGATWTVAPTTDWGESGTANRYENGSLFIDLDDYAHVAYKNPNDGFIYYRRGTPNAGRTAWTWSAASTVVASLEYDYPDIVAHREGTGWTTHVVCTRGANNSVGAPLYNPITITSGGSIAVGSSTSLNSASYGNTNKTWPSIDFNHTGDGKTVAGGTPHLYAAWSAGATGAGKGIRFKKATYSGGTWTWGTEREIDSTRFVDSVSSRWLNCLFDGTRVVLVGSFTGTDVDIAIWDRDVADTTTTARAVFNGGGNDRFFYGSATYDSVGNLYILGQGPYSGVDGRLGYKKWTRSGNSYGSTVTVDATVPDASTRGVFVSAKRGYSNQRIESIYTDGTASPFDVTYDSILLNQAPNAPTNLTPAGGTVIDRTITQRFDWDFSDPDAGDTQSKYDLRYRVVGAGTWTDILNQSTTNTFHDFAGGTFAAGDYEWQVRTYDAQGTVGPYSSSALFTAASPPTAPTITDPINNQVIGANSYTMLWSASNQASYQVRTVADNAGAPNTGTVYTDTGEVVSSTDRARSVAFAVNSRFEHVQVRVKYQGLWSTWASVRVEVSYTPPPTPTFQLIAGTSTLDVDITNPAPGAGEPTVTSNDVYVNDGGGEERKVTGVAQSGTWTYRTPVSGRNYSAFVRVVAHGDNGTSTSS
jgi:hypothetical protein